MNLRGEKLMIDPKWKTQAVKALRDGVDIKTITKTMWHKQPINDWRSYGIKNQRELKEYLKMFLETWE